MDRNTLLSVMKEAVKYSNNKRDIRNSMPCFTAVKITVKDNQMNIQTTDLKTYFDCTVPTDAQDISTCIHAIVLSNLIKTLDKGNIELSYTTKINMYKHDKIKTGTEIHESTYKGEVTKYEADIYKDILIDDIQDVSCLVIKQGNSVFHLKEVCPYNEFPPLPIINNGLTAKNIMLKDNVTATIYEIVVDRSDCAENYDYHEKAGKKQAFALYPKYLKIDGVIAERNKIRFDYDKRKYYCPYSIGDQFEQNIFVDEIENYEEVK